MNVCNSMKPAQMCKPGLRRHIDTARINSYTRSDTRMKGEFYLISMAAQMLDMHPQTLRKYERLGLVRPVRTGGSMRVYTRDELDRLRLIKTLVDEGGINLAGVQRLLSIAEVALRLRPLISDSRRGTADHQRRLTTEIDALCRLLGLEDAH
jgi:MerR family transcriptional regulator/heat shock protein HspR